MENKDKTTLKSLYTQIREQLFKMIPEKWESIYLYASVIENKNHTEQGEMFFYYYPQSVIKKNPVNVYEVPGRFNIEENQYVILAKQLYDMIKKLRHICTKLDKETWSNIAISIENVEFLAEYNFDDLKNSVYTNDDRRMVWEYKYLNYPIEKYNRTQRKMIEKYLREEEMGGHPIKMYSETFYQKHVHNDIQYNVEKETYMELDTDNRYNNKTEERKVKNQLLKLDKDVD